MFRVGEQVYFLPEATAFKVLPMPDVARVPGGPEELVGVALVEGEMIPVVAVGPLETRSSRRSSSGFSDGAASRPMLVCTYLGERVGLVGLEIIATGRFESGLSDHVVHGGANAPFFDIGAVVGRLREGRWAV